MRDGATAELVFLDDGYTIGQIPMLGVRLNDDGHLAWMWLSNPDVPRGGEVTGWTEEDDSVLVVLDDRTVRVRTLQSSRRVDGNLEVWCEAGQDR